MAGGGEWWREGGVSSRGRGLVSRGRGLVRRGRGLVSRGRGLVSRGRERWQEEKSGGEREGGASRSTVYVVYEALSC